MQKGDKIIIALFIVAAVFIFLAHKNEKKYEPRSKPPPSTLPIETIKDVPYIGTCGQLSGCEKGA